MTMQDWGAIGEILGAIAVVVTLIYLAKQIRMHSLSLDESRKLALAQTYQRRSDALQEMLVLAADSEHLAPLIVKLIRNGYPENLAALDMLDSEEHGRFRLWQIAQQTHWENLYYQYQQGYLDEEYYESIFKERVRRLAPVWRALDISSERQSFSDEIARLDPQAGGQSRLEPHGEPK